MLSAAMHDTNVLHAQGYTAQGTYMDEFRRIDGMVL